MSHILNPKDIDGLKQWFKEHSHLSINDQAQLLDLSVRTVKRHKKKAGLLAATRKPLAPRPYIATTPIMDVPDDWRTNVVWLQQIVDVYGVRQLAKLVQLSRATVRVTLKRLNIKIKSPKEAAKSKNKHCTYEWCHRHYVELGYSQQTCGDLAGIGQQTFSNWLNRFKIPVRDAEQTENGRKEISLWEKDFIARLRQQSTVRRVYVRDGYIHVRYKNYFWENYYTRPVPHPKRPYTYFKIDANNTTIKKVPTVYPEYGVDLQGKPFYPAHISISKLELKNASMVEQRLAIHEYARQIISRGWIWPSYPESVLLEDFQRVTHSDLSKYMENGGFTAHPKCGMSTPIGRKLMLHFFDLSQFWDILKRPRIVVRYLNVLLAKNTKFNLFNLILTASANIFRLRTAIGIPDPMVYAAIFKKMQFSGTILDINVGMGNRAIAAAAAGLKYTTADPKFNVAIENGFHHFTGLEYDPYTEQKVDIAIYDEGFKPPDMTKVLPYLGEASKLLVFCPHTHTNEVLKYKPQTAIRIRTRLYRKTPDYIFIW